MRDRVYKGESLEDRLENAAAAKRMQVEKMRETLAKRKADAERKKAASAAKGKSRK